MGEGQEGDISGSNTSRDLERREKTMELQIQPYELPSVPQFNYEELKATLTEKCHHYETIVYTDDDIKQAKSDRADLNKLKRALNEERIRLEKEYMVPFNQFKTQINEIVSIIEKPAALIDSRVKEFEQKKKDEKREQIAALFADFGFPEYITLEKIWDDSWLNSTVSLSRVKEDFKTVAFRSEKEMQTLSELPEYSFEAKEIYKKTLSLAQAMDKATECARIAKAKKAAAEKAIEDAQVREEIPFTDEVKEEEATPAAEEHFWVTFKAYLTPSEALELRSFFDYHKIKFEAILDEN